jgi:hypothetical protein
MVFRRYSCAAATNIIMVNLTKTRVFNELSCSSIILP